MKAEKTTGGIQIIGAGFGRSGTMSLRKALKLLGYSPCYHMQVALFNYSHLKFWVRAKAGRPVDYQRFFRKYKATVDWPACEFYRELMETFPEAMILLNIRDPEAWYDSMFSTIWAIQPVLRRSFPKYYRKIHDDLIWNSRFNGAFANRHQTIEIYKARIEEVRNNVPQERLLVFDVGEGWKPLCDFLGIPVPENIPFPHLNDRKMFRSLILALKLLEWLVPALVIGGLTWIVFTLL